MGAGTPHFADRILNTPWVFHSFRGLIDPGQVGHLRRVFARVPHASLLDLGCGIGSHCGMTDAAYTGVDLTPSYIGYAATHYAAPNRRFVVGDAFMLDPALGHHDVVALINIIHHFSDAEVVRALQAAAAVTPQRVAIIDVARERAGFLFNRVFAPLDRGAHFRPQAAQRALLEAAGYRIEWEDGYVTTTGIYPHSVLVALAPGAAA